MYESQVEIFEVFVPLGVIVRLSSRVKQGFIVPAEATRLSTETKLLDPAMVILVMYGPCETKPPKLLTRLLGNDCVMPLDRVNVIVPEVKFAE